MNKFLMTALLFVAGAALAAIAPIDGDNTVAIMPVTAPADGSTIITVPYVSCLAGGVAATLQAGISTYGLAAAESAANADAADRLVVLYDNEGTDEFWYYYNDAANGWTAITTAQVQPDGSSVALTPESAATFTLDRGRGFWLKRPANASATLYLQGELTTDPQSTPIASGYNLIGIAADDQIALNSVNWSGAYAVEGNLLASDTIIVPTAGGTAFANYYRSYSSGKWVDKRGNAANVTLKGHGFWYVRRAETGFNFQPSDP